MMNGAPMLMEDEEDVSEEVFLEEMATEKPKSKCAIKCRTECGQGQQADASNATATEEPAEEGEPALNATELEALKAKGKNTSGKTVVSRKCLNHCGGLCRQLCGKNTSGKTV